MDTNEIYFKTFIVLLVIELPIIAYFMLDIIFPKREFKMLKKIFYFVLYCFRTLLAMLFVLFLFLILPIISIYWLFFGNDLFNYLNEVVKNIENIMQKKLEENKEKFIVEKLIEIRSLKDCQQNDKR